MRQKTVFSNDEYKSQYRISKRVNGENSALKAPEALMVHFCIFLMIVLRNQEYINTVLKTVQKTY